MSSTRPTKKPKTMANNETTSSTKLTMKLLINSSTNKVLFAEADKQVIDFLFGLLEMPLGSVVKLLTNNEAPSTIGGSIENLHNSIQAMDDTYLQNSGIKATLVDPLSAKSSLSHTTLLLPDVPANANKKFYRSSSCGHNYVTDVCGIPCPCGQSSSYKMNIEMSFVPANTVSASGNVSANAKDGDGFVKGVVTYSIMDDLTVTPMSMISSIAMLNKFKVKDVGGLEEKIVELGFDEGLALLKASLKSKTALTDVFLKNSK